MNELLRLWARTVTEQAVRQVKNAPGCATTLERPENPTACAQTQEKASGQDIVTVSALSRKRGRHGTG